jgi:hypothetical protein
MPPVAMRDVSLYRPNQDELVLRVNGARSLHRRPARPARATVLQGQAEADPGSPVHTEVEPGECVEPG